MKYRTIWLICAMILVQNNQVQAVSILELLKEVPSTVYAAGQIAVSSTSLGLSYVANKFIYDSKQERKKQRRAQDHQVHLDQVSAWSPQQLEEYLVRVNGCNTIYQVPASYLFEQYTYYQFPEFQKLLIDHPLFEESIIKLHRKIKNGKKFDFYTQEEQKKFEEAVCKLANIIDERIAAQRLEAQETQKRVEFHCLKQEKQDLYKQHINVTLNQEKEEQSLLCECYAQEIEFRDHSGNQIPKELEARHKALIEHAEDKDVWMEQHYALPAHTHKLLDEHAIQADNYMRCYGNQIQQVIHREFISILDGTARLRYVNLLDQDAKAVTTTITLFAHAGHLHNHAGHIPAALSFADFCWNVLELSEPFTRAVIEGFLGDFKCIYPYGVAGVRGAWKGTKKFGNNLVAAGRFCRDAAYHCAHPIETARIACPKIKACAEFIAQRIAEGHAQQEKLIKSNSPLLFYWHIPTKKEIALRETQHKEAIDLTVQAAHQFLEALPTYLTPEAIEHGVEKSTEIATEMALSYATGRAIGAMAQTGAHALAASLEELTFMHEVPATMGSMQACIVLEATELAEAAIALRAAGDGFAAGGDLLGKLGSAGTGLNDIAPVGDQGTIFDYPKDPSEVAKAIEIEKARVAELARIQSKFKIPVTGVEEIHGSLVNLDLNSCKHIAHTKHNWHKFVKDPNDYEAIFRFMTKIYKEGTVKQETIDVFLSTLNIFGEKAQVKWVKNAQGIFLSNGWIK